jgi:type I restriction enzyme S subunit
MSPGIDITTEQRKTLLALLRRFIPGVAVWAYGSRVKWTARPNSDLDLVAFTAPEQSSLVSELKETLAESDLPFLVDFHVWDEVPERFHEIIRKEYVVLQEAERIQENKTVTGEYPITRISDLADSISETHKMQKEQLIFLNTSDILHGKFLHRRYSSVKDWPGQAKKSIQKNDILFSEIRPSNGRWAFVEEEAGDYVVSTKLMVIRARSDRVFPKFLYQYLTSTEITGWLQHLAESRSGTFPQITFDEVASLELPLPPLAEQKIIAHIIGTLNDKIELNRQMNVTLEAMARALFQSWFVDFDPVRAKLDGCKPTGLDAATAALFPSTFQDSRLGHIPTGWDAIPLYETAQWVNGAAFKSEDFCATGDGLPVIKIAELKDGIGAQTKWCQRDAGSNQIIDTGDLLYSWSGSPDTSLEAFLWSGGRGLLNQHIFKVIAPTVVEKRFVYYLLQYLRPVLVETARNKQTTGLGHVTIADMKRLLVCWPNKVVLAAFDRNIAPIFDKAFTNTLESRTLSTLRDALLPKLLSGEIHAAKVEEEAASV